MTLVKPWPDRFVLAIFLWEQSLDIGKFGSEIPNLAMGAWRRRAVVFHREETRSPSVSVAEKIPPTCQGQLDQSGGPWEAKPARPALCFFGFIGPCSVQTVH